ncbi:MAG: FHA domain-containing protein [Thermoguttaceae bacterium]|nr:FHA domain-containing protein [Thermoguttaceae bacterium]
MSAITLRIIDGPDRGKVFENLTLPVTLGRDDGNLVVLNDDRVSRFHVKLFEENGKVALVDLGSTNGTLINGEPISIWAMRPGDVILLGRTYLLFGTKAEIASRLRKLSRGAGAKDPAVPEGAVPVSMGSSPPNESLSLGGTESNSATEIFSTSLQVLEREFLAELSPSEIAQLHSLTPPPLPDSVTADQAQWLSQWLLYVTLQLRVITGSVSSPGAKDANVDELFAQRRSEKKERSRKTAEEADDSRVTLPPRQWQNLLDLYGLVSHYLSHLNK